MVGIAVATGVVLFWPWVREPSAKALASTPSRSKTDSIAAIAEASNRE
jgi:hypothetical protein